MTEPGETTYWMDRPVLGLDLESTGLDTENDRPVSVALAPTRSTMPATSCPRVSGSGWTGDLPAL